ncbi:MAG: hypothetical protein ABIH00_03040 [Armatimonadota bacterium]
MININGINIDALLLVLMVLASLWAVMARSLLKAAIALAVVSALLTIVMFRLNSPLAGVFELSICAGLITALFISVISLTNRTTVAEEMEITKKRIRKYWLLPVLVVVAGFLLVMVKIPFDFTLPAPALDTNVKLVFWNLRLTDLLGQIIALLVGVFGVVVLLKEVVKK